MVPTISTTFRIADTFDHLEGRSDRVNPRARLARGYHWRIESGRRRPSHRVIGKGTVESSASALAISPIGPCDTPRLPVRSHPPEPPACVVGGANLDCVPSGRSSTGRAWVRLAGVPRSRSSQVPTRACTNTRALNGCVCRAGCMYAARMGGSPSRGYGGTLCTSMPAESITCQRRPR